MTLNDLYRLADKEHVSVYGFPLQQREALSVMDDNGNCYIAIDPKKVKSVDDEKTKIAHELGHCVTGAFYNVYSPYDIRQKQENRADKWAIERLIPRDEFESAVRDGYTEPWELSELFGVDEALMRRAMIWYAQGRLNA